MSRIVVVSEHQVTTLLPMRDCIAVMEQALLSLARGEVHQPLRNLVRATSADGFLGLMPAYRGGASPVYALKEVAVFPGNPARGLDTHLGAVLLHDGMTGELQAIVNASAVTAIRTAAVSAVATRLLAPDDAGVLAIIGAGVQARAHLEAIPLVREIRTVHICGRTAARVEDLVRIARGRGLEVIVCDSVEEALSGADIVVTATNSREPVVRRGWLKGGAHVNAVGSSVAGAREIDSATVAAAALFVDRRESTVNESGDYLFALREGAISGPGHIRAELGELLLGTATGRTSSDELTLFKSLGLAIEDLACAQFLYERCLASGEGTWVEF
jgi:ornithine cyclodeaminase